jgi:hypothetical protein
VCQRTCATSSTREPNRSTETAELLSARARRRRRLGKEAILLILASWLGLVVWGAFPQKFAHPAGVIQCWRHLEALSPALDSYRREHGRLPENLSALGPAAVTCPHSGRHYEWVTLGPGEPRAVTCRAHLFRLVYIQPAFLRDVYLYYENAPTLVLGQEVFVREPASPTVRIVRLIWQEEPTYSEVAARAEWARGSD